MKKNKLITALLLLFCTFFLKTPTAHAKAKWELGGGVGFGFGAFINFFTSDSAWRYSSMGGMVNGSINLSPRVKLRLTLGLENENKNLDGINFEYFFFMKNFLPIGEISTLFHVLKEPTLFDPYFITGLGFPNILHVGIGNQFRLSNKVSLYAEALGSTAIIHQRGDLRAGVKFRF